MNKKIIIGLTGGFCTGKSTVADMFVQKGARKIDADEIAHDLIKNDKTLKTKIVETFGETIIDNGEIDRRKLARLVFFDKDALDKLNNILHSAIIKRIKDEAEKIIEGVVVIDAPLLIESGLHYFVDKVVVVNTKKETQVQRAINRGISREEAEKVINMQMPLPEKVKCADFVIDNDLDIEKTKKGVEEIWQKI